MPCRGSMARLDPRRPGSPHPSGMAPAMLMVAIRVAAAKAAERLATATMAAVAVLWAVVMVGAMEVAQGVAMVGVRAEVARAGVWVAMRAAVVPGVAWVAVMTVADRSWRRWRAGKCSTQQIGAGGQTARP